ncbi:MAG: alkaline phosphatase family protein [Planctomycetes bacterium]|nr:alkaline phosphatase family protein [Planctomycetota bacterium]
MGHLHRREFLGLAAAGAGVLALNARGAAPVASSTSAARKTKRVVLVAFAGGVRTRDTFGTPENVPNLKKLADEGVLYTRARTANLGHFGAALSIFTGIAEQRGIRENARGPYPTLFEYARKDLGLAANDVWITTSGGAQQVNYAYGLHAEYGAEYGANTLDGEGIFNKEFKRVLDALGRPRELPKDEEAVLKKLRASLAQGGAAGLNSAESAAQVERYILQELTRGTADLTGANAGDAKALRLARNLVSLFKPKLTAVVLQDADTAHGSYNGYAEVIRRNDAALGELVQAVRADPELANSTALIVVPEFGRDRDLNSRRGLDHGDGSEDLSNVACLCWGPDFKRGEVVKDEVQVVDVTPTVCELLGARAKLAKGKRLPGLFG